MLALESVRSGYDGVPIVRGLSLTIKQGASTAIVGRNGVGKTTLPMSRRMLKKAERRCSP